MFFLANLVTELFDQSASATLFISLYGTVLFGFAYANWMVRNVPLGGIYGRAIITGNLIQIISGLGLLLGNVLNTPNFWPSIALFVCYTLLSAGFTMLLFSKGPFKPKAKS